MQTLKTTDEPDAPRQNNTNSAQPDPIRACQKQAEGVTVERDRQPARGRDPGGKNSPRQQTALRAVEQRERAIAQRQYAEDKLWRSEEFARRIVESGIDCVKVLDLDGHLEYMSPSGQSAMEVGDLSAWLGRSWLGLWKREDTSRIEGAMATARRGGVGAFQAARAAVASGQKYWDVRIAPVLGRDGAVERLVAVARDMTELRRAQQIAIQAEKLAAAGRMAATIAHEINNPLEAVTNFLYLARLSPGLPDETARQLEIADRELTRVVRIAQKTLGFYRDTAKQNWISVREAIEDILLIYERKLRFKHIDIALEADAALKAFTKQGELKQALSNLLANAIDASREGGCIWVRARAGCRRGAGNEPGIRIVVADNGSGMTPEVQKRIFAPFFTTKPDTGTGIGLWITRSLIEQQGGTLRFRSRRGRGTVMSLFLVTAQQKFQHAAAA